MLGPMLLEKPWERKRSFCPRCLNSATTCLCRHIRPFDPKIRFVILIHGREARNRISTGRFSHLCLEGSRLVSGYEYSNDAQVNDLLADPEFHSVVLYPGENSLNLSQLPDGPRNFPAGKKLQIFVIDGTWSTAPKLLASKNLESLPRISFDPPGPSRFRIRAQPKAFCYSTAEAIHQTIELLGPSQGFQTREHDTLLHVFSEMVEQQIQIAARPKLWCQWSPKNRH